ncbi:MAG: glycosyltransferase [Alphaproteobacteria bacterium]|nr:MAG: glycosyltransferase [Alphaproteobacteria bacterium]
MDWILSSPALSVSAVLDLLIWGCLIFLRGGYWRAGPYLDDTQPSPSTWPPVVALVPARNEADVIADALGALAAQDYPGRFNIIVIDDHSDDATAAAARAAIPAARAACVRIIAARDLPAGWTGKLWALEEGLREAATFAPRATYVWLSDADIAHSPATLRRLVAKAERERRDLVSLMVVLSCRTPWERLLIPPFVYFFRLLYPFAWANDPRRRTAAAAGGCVLVRRDALSRIGGFAALRDALIDDCTLARRIKDLSGAGDPAAAGGGIWIGLGTESRSLRPYRGLGDIWRMVARTAYTQLRHSPILLAAAIAGLSITYLAPPALLLAWPWHGQGAAALLGAGAWMMMVASMQPTLRLYRQPVWLGLLLPVAAALYALMTADSAWRHWCGRGGAWKGRTGPLEPTPPAG